MGKPRDKRTYLICFCLAVLTLAVYWQVWDFEFIAVDDFQYVHGNPPVAAGLSSQTVRWALTGVGAGNWHPLTWISLMADRDLASVLTWVFDIGFGHGDSGVYHLTNLALHLANVVLLFLLLTQVAPLSSPLAKGGKRGVWRGAFVALLFAIHPMHVESVAWVSERKDVLSTLFWLLTMWAYVRHVDSPDPRRYGLVALFLALGLMAKPMLVTLPIVLLLMDYWPLGRFNREILKHRNLETPFGFSLFRSFAIEKAPLFAITLASCGITFYVQRIEGAVAPTDFIGMGARVANALVSYAAYVGKMFWPVDMAAFYPHARTGMPWWWAPAAAAGLAVVTVIAWRLARRAPYVLVGWLWYLITLVPVIGIVQVGGQAMADRYTYVPYIGLFIAIVWGVPDLLGTERARGRAAGLAVCAMAVATVLIAVSYRQVGCWRDDVSMWSHTIAVTGPNPRAHYNLGCAYDTAGELDLAARQYRAALKIEPVRSDAHNNLGFVLLRQDRLDEAKPHFEAAIKGNPRSSEAHNNLGLLLANQGKIREAIPHFRQAVKLNPRDEKARGNLEAALTAR